MIINEKVDFCTFRWSTSVLVTEWKREERTRRREDEKEEE